MKKVYALEIFLWIASIAIAFYTYVYLAEMLEIQRGYSAIGGEMFVPVIIVLIAYVLIGLIIRPLERAVRNKEKVKEIITRRNKQFKEVRCLQAIANILPDNTVIIHTREGESKKYSSFEEYLKTL